MKATIPLIDIALADLLRLPSSELPAPKRMDFLANVTPASSLEVMSDPESILQIYDSEMVARPEVGLDEYASWAIGSAVIFEVGSCSHDFANAYRELQLDASDFIWMKAREAGPYIGHDISLIGAGASFGGGLESSEPHVTDADVGDVPASQVFSDIEADQEAIDYLLSRGADSTQLSAIRQLISQEVTAKDPTARWVLEYLPGYELGEGPVVFVVAFLPRQELGDREWRQSVNEKLGLLLAPDLDDDIVFGIEYES